MFIITMNDGTIYKINNPNNIIEFKSKDGLVSFYLDYKNEDESPIFICAYPICNIKQILKTKNIYLYPNAEFIEYK